MLRVFQFLWAENRAKLFLEDKLTIPKCLEDDKCLQAGVSLNIHSFEKTPDVYLSSHSTDRHYNRLLSCHLSWPSHPEHSASPLSELNVYRMTSDYDI